MEMVEVDGYCIDRWEAHLVVLAADGSERPHPHHERPPAEVRCAARSSAGAFPQAYISRLEASAACEAANKRLCTLREWYRACTGPRGLLYPYGPEFSRAKCNVSKPHLLTRLFGADPRSWEYDRHFNDPRLDQEPGFLARAGDYAECVSAEGVHDLAGNLHEWVKDSVDFDLPQKIPLRADIQAKIGKNRGHGIFMGGFFSTTSQHGEGCRFLTPGHEPKYHDYSTGFRCCKDPGP